MDIGCKKINCVYNKGLHCNADKIAVGSDLDCKTFVKDENKTTKTTNHQNKTMFEVATLEKYEENEAVKIECKATKCLFNKSGHCTANGISVLSSRKSAFCATSINK